MYHLKITNDVDVYHLFRNAGSFIMVLYLFSLNKYIKLQGILYYFKK